MTDHFLYQNNKNQNPIVKEESSKGNTPNNSSANNKKHKLSHKVAPEKQISLYSLIEPNVNKEKNCLNKNNIKVNSTIVQSNQIPCSEKDFKPSKKSFESPLHQSKKFNSNINSTKTSKDAEFKYNFNDPLCSPTNNTSNAAKLGSSSNKFNISKIISNTNLPISTIPKASITMSPSSTTHKSMDSNLSQNSIYNLKRSEKSDEDVNKHHLQSGGSYSISHLINKNSADLINFNSNNLVTSNTLNLLNTSNSVNNNSKKSNDFKLKYKTEKCKFWELYKECKYADNVS